MELKELGRNDLGRISEFLRPIFIKTYKDKVTGGTMAAERIFDAWDTPPALEKKISRGVRYFMFTEGGKDLGLVALKTEEDGVLYLDKLYIAENAQGKGLGTRAMEFVLSFGRDHGCDMIATHVNGANLPAIHLYGKFGMRPAVTVHRCHDGGEYDYTYLVGPVDTSP